MTASTYISADGIAKLPDKIYYGSPDNLAMNIGKVYIGDPSGIARQIFPSNTEPPVPPVPPVPPIPTNYLIQNGISVNEDLTGGWKTTTPWNSVNEPREPNIASGSDYISIYQPRYGNGQDIGYDGFYQTKNAIDLSNYTKLKVDGYVSRTGGWARGYVGILKSNLTDMDKYAYINKISRNEFTLDISSYTNSQKITIQCVGYGTRINVPFYVYIYNLWLE